VSQDILAQDDETCAWSTSEIAGIIEANNLTFKGFPGQSRHHENADKESRRRDAQMQGAIMGSYKVWSEGSRYNVDKSRDVMKHALQLEKMFEPKLLVHMRSLPAVLWSLERLHRDNPEISLLPDEIESLEQRLMYWVDPRALVGRAIFGLYNMVNIMDPKNYMIFQCEAWSVKPKPWFREARQFLGLPEFDHDFKEIHQTATDLDAVMFGMYPHRTKDGKPRPLTPVVVDAWKQDGALCKTQPEAEALMDRVYESSPVAEWSRNKFYGDGMKVLP
jgi:hypothetical protein